MNKIFKIGLLILGIILLFLYSGHDRYELHISTDENQFVVFDKREGYVYVIGEETKGYSLDIIGCVKKHESGNKGIHKSENPELKMRENKKEEE